MNTTGAEQTVRNFLSKNSILSSGRTFYVNNATPTEGRAAGVDAVANGRRADFPLATVAFALTLCTAGAGNVIVVGQGHSESITSAAAIACSVSGVTIIGQGSGRMRPTFTWSTSTAATVTISGAGVTWKNCVFVGTGVDSIVTMFAVTADDTTFDSCEFETGNATNQTLLGITLTGVDRFKFINNHVHGTSDAGTTNFIQCVGSAGKQKDFRIDNNDVMGAFTTTLGFFNNITVAMVNASFRENHIVNLTASATKCIVCLTGSTGKVMNNRFGIGSGAAPITMDAGWWSGNWSAAAVATNGTLV